MKRFEKDWKGTKAGSHSEMKHPFQHLILEKDVLFAAAINSVFVFKLDAGKEGPAAAQLLGSWTDDIDPYYSIRKHHRELLEEYERQQLAKQQQEQAASEKNENNKREIVIPDKMIPTSQKQGAINKRPKLPLPGPGAPPTYTYIRQMYLSRNKDRLIVTTDNDKAVVVFRINMDNKDNVLELVKRQPFPKRPSAICTSMDDKEVIIADKFGDVYSISMDPDSKILSDDELVPILGHVSMLTGVECSVDENSKPVIFSADRDEHIRISYYPKSFVVKKWLFGHKEFISSLVLPSWLDGRVLVSAGGDQFIKTWNWQTDESFSIDITSLIEDKLTDKHLTPEKFQNEKGDQQEYCISHLVPVQATKQIIAIFERIPYLFLFNLADDGQLSYVDEFKVSNDIITATASNDKLILSLDNMEKPLEIYQVGSSDLLTLLPNSESIMKQIEDSNDTVVGDVDELIPLFNTNYLRKRREY